MITITDSLQKLLYEKIVTDGLSATEATDALMGDWEAGFSGIEDSSMVDLLLTLVRPLISDKAKRIYRNHTRQLENRVFSDQPIKLKRVNPLTGETTDSDELMNWHEAQKRLLERSFNLPDGRWVRYSDSTAEDHEMRARWQDNRAASIQKDADRHDALAKLMRQHEVDTLGELDVELWRDLMPSS